MPQIHLFAWHDSYGIPYTIYPKYWDTLFPYHTGPKILISPFYYPFRCLNCHKIGKQCRSSSDTSDLGLQLLRLVWPNIRVKICMWNIQAQNRCSSCSEPVQFNLYITKTCLYDPLKPHFYTVKLGFTGYTLFFLFLLKNIDCGYLLEPPHQGGSNKYPQSMFWAEIWKISVFLPENFQFLEVKFSIYLNRRVFIMYISGYYI